MRPIKWYQFNILSLMVLTACLAAILGLWRISQVASIAAVAYASLSALLMIETTESDDQSVIQFVRSCIAWSLAFVVSLVCLVVTCWTLLAKWTG